MQSNNVSFVSFTQFVLFHPDVLDGFVAAICIMLVYYVYAMLSLCLLSHGLNRVEGKLFKSGQKCEN